MPKDQLGGPAEINQKQKQKGGQYSSRAPNTMIEQADLLTFRWD
jgi:hypothetical protein